MVYFTGDTHGSAFEVVRFNLTAADTVVILGDVGANFCLDERDIAMKMALHRLKPTILCIHGNHEIRPASIPSYITKDWSQVLANLLSNAVKFTDKGFVEVSVRGNAIP